jgi:hypothetical protein
MRPSAQKSRVLKETSRGTAPLRKRKSLKADGANCMYGEAQVLINIYAGPCEKIRSSLFMQAPFKFFKLLKIYFFNTIMHIHLSKSAMKREIVKSVTLQLPFPRNSSNKNHQKITSK